jgi:outer membrane protein assembly complex protein YaeT
MMTERGASRISVPARAVRRQRVFLGFVVLVLCACGSSLLARPAEARLRKPNPPSTAQQPVTQKATPPPKPKRPPRRHGEARTGDVVVKQLDVVGVHAFRKKELKNVLATKASSRWPWGEKHYFSPDDFADDLKRVHAFYADRGYPQGRVVKPDVVFSDRKDTVSITLTIEEGPAIRIESVDLFGFDDLPERTRAWLKRTLPIQPGAIRRQDTLVAARDRCTQIFNERGHPYARVQALEGEGSKPNTVRLTLAAEPGTKAKFGPVEITGNSSVSEKVIRRQLAFGQGDEFRLSRLTESQRRLYGLELFQYINFDVPDLASQPLEVPVKAIITEGKHRRVQFGVGYGTEEKARVSANWRHVNFFGGARTLSLEGKWSSLDRGARATFTEPFFFSPSYKLNLSAQNWYSDEPAFTLLTRGGRASVSREIVRRDPSRRRFSTTRATLTFIDEFEHQTISNEALNDPTFRDELIALGLDPRSGDQQGTLVAFALDLTHDTTRNLLDARNGYVVSLHLEQAGSWLPGNFSYEEATIEGRHYQSVASRVVIANRLRLGSITAPGSEDVNVPFFKRYFLGGSTSVRGWGRYELSPLTETGQPIGGLSVVETSGELRVPFGTKLSAVAFVDAGSVGRNPWHLDPGGFRVAGGPGVRYDTPIGPVRFDVGYQLNPIPGLLVDGKPQNRPWRAHVSIGQAF